MEKIEAQSSPLLDPHSRSNFYKEFPPNTNISKVCVGGPPQTILAHPKLDLKHGKNWRVYG
jgi:hypothetical protein